MRFSQAPISAVDLLISQLFEPVSASQMWLFREHMTEMKSEKEISENSSR